MEIIKKMHYKSKLILCYLVLVSFPLILCLILLYQSIVKPVRENAVSAIDQRLEQELSTINSKIEKIRNVSYLVSTNTVINKFFVPKFYGDLELIEILNNDISPLLSWLEASSPEVSYYHFFTNNPSIPDTQYLHHYDDYRSEPWMQEMEQSVFDKGYYLEPYHQNRSYSFGYGVEDQMVYSLFYPLLTANNFLEVCIKPSVFFEDMKAIPAMESGFVAAVNRDGKLSPTFRQRLPPLSAKLWNRVLQKAAICPALPTALSSSLWNRLSICCRFGKSMLWTAGFSALFPMLRSSGRF